MLRRLGLPRSPILGTSFGAAAILGLSTAYAYLDPDCLDRLTGKPTPGASCSSSATGPIALPEDESSLASSEIPIEESVELPSCCQGSTSRGALLASLAEGTVSAPSAAEDERNPGRDEEDVPTFTRDIAPLLQAHCQECHRPGQIGPFPLVTYEDARSHGFDLATVTFDRRMPPWLAAPDFGDIPFRHDRSLTEEQIETFQAWADAGMPEGDPEDLPPAPEFSEGWVLGEPDVIIEMAEPFEVPAGGLDIHRCFVIPNPLPEDAEIIGIEYKPGNPRVVHHVLGYIDVSGQAREKDAEDELAGYECQGGPMIDIRGDLGGWAPGANPDFLPEGIGRILPKGSDLVLQVHYHPSGKAETDVTRVGLFLAPKEKPIKKALHWWAAGNTDFRIPAGEDSFEVVADTLPLPCDVEVHAVSPHMHLLGTDMTMFAETPSGERIDLIRIDQWDFNWQLQYMLERPVLLPEGSVVKAIAHYDNSEGNPNQAVESPVEVGFGDWTTDEMCFGFFAVTKVGQDLTRGDPDDLHLLFRKQLAEAYKEMERERRSRGTRAGDVEAGDRE